MRPLLQSSGLRHLVAYLTITVISHEPAASKSEAVFGNHPPNGGMTNNTTRTHPQTSFLTTTKYFSNCVQFNASVYRNRPSFFFSRTHDSFYKRLHGLGLMTQRDYILSQ